MNKPLGLLIVENNPKHLADAKLYFAEREVAGIVRVTYASTLAEAEQRLNEYQYGGIISDLFFPIGKDETSTQETLEILFKCLRPFAEINTPAGSTLSAMELWRSGSKEPPAGVLVCFEAIKRKIPVVINTDTYHHGIETEPINRWCGVYGDLRYYGEDVGSLEEIIPKIRGPRINMIETGEFIPHTEERLYDECAFGTSKNWEHAYLHIISHLVDRRLPGDGLDNYRILMDFMRNPERYLASIRKSNLEGSLSSEKLLAKEELINKFIDARQYFKV